MSLGGELHEEALSPFLLVNLEFHLEDDSTLKQAFVQERPCPEGLMGVQKL